MAKLYFKYGAMNSGKTTDLIQAAFNYEERGMTVLVIKPYIDTKGSDYIVSRIGAQRKVDILTTPEMNLYDEVLKINLYGKIDCVFSDESQFLEPHQVDELLRVAVMLDIPVICYGLRTDFLMNGFPGATRLLQIAHSLEELKTICSCGKKAVINARLVGGKYVFEGSQIAIDDQDSVSYQALCAECYFKAKEKYLTEQQV